MWEFDVVWGVSRGVERHLSDEIDALLSLQACQGDV